MYDRDKAVAYAHKWAYGRNPRYADFSLMGGDCTNFMSQCLIAGGAKMDYTMTFGWYYVSLSNRAPAWSGVQAFYQFLVNKEGPGPDGKVIEIKDIFPGDIIQLSFDGASYSHSLIVVETGKRPDIANTLIATHTIDRDNTLLEAYAYKKYRCLKINA